MKTSGTVLSVKDGQAYVRVCRESACASCKGCAQGQTGCHAEFMFSEAPAAYELYACNPLGASEGDRVELCSKNGLSLSLAFAVFLLPFILAAAAYFITARIAGQGLAAAAAGIAFFIFFLVFAFAANRFCAGHAKTTICKIIKESGK